MLTTLRERVPPDPSWEVQEALAQAFDACCAAIEALIEGRPIPAEALAPSEEVQTI